MVLPVAAIAASAVVLRQNEGRSQMLLMKRAKEDGNFWCHVAGGIEADEAAWQTALREISEETGLTVLELFNSEYIEQFYESRNNRIMLVPFFVARVASEENVVLNDEHSDYRWCTLEEAKQLAPFIGQHKVYEHVWQYFVEQQPHPILQIEFDSIDQSVRKNQ